MSTEAVRSLIAWGAIASACFVLISIVAGQRHFDPSPECESYGIDRPTCAYIDMRFKRIEEQRDQ